MVRAAKTLCLLAALQMAACAAGKSAPKDTPDRDPTADGFRYERRYEPGAVHRYRIERRYLENGALKYVQEVVSVHAVVDGSPARERIHFERSVQRQAGEERDRSAELAKFPPYEVSIAPGAGGEDLQLPDLTGWDMDLVGVVTDLNTFLVAISPQAGIDRAVRPGQPHSLPEPAVASWANGAGVPLGEDCIRISVTLKRLTPGEAVYETRFAPPARACLEPVAAFAAAPVEPGTPNNFQQKMKMGEAFGVMWGRERFTVTSTVRRTDGLLLHAEMSNDLALRLKVGCDEALTACQAELPLQLHRDLTMALLGR